MSDVESRELGLPYAFGDYIFVAALLVFVVEFFVGRDAFLADAGRRMQTKTFLDHGILRGGR